MVKNSIDYGSVIHSVLNIKYSLFIFQTLIFFLPNVLMQTLIVDTVSHISSIKNNFFWLSVPLVFKELLQLSFSDYIVKFIFKILRKFFNII